MNNLRKYREKRGLSVEDVASFLGKSASTIRAWESGEYIPNGTAFGIRAICSIYGCTIEDLIAIERAVLISRGVSEISAKMQLKNTVDPNGRKIPPACDRPEIFHSPGETSEH